MSNLTSISGKLQLIVGAEHVRAAAPSDSLSGKQPESVVSPGNEQELAEVLACADQAGIAVIPRGGGTKLAWGNPPRKAELVLSTLRLNRVQEHAWADLTVTVEAGCTLKSLQEILAQHNQRLALDGLWPDRATIGGMLSTNDSGALRLRFGSLRDLILGVTLALPDGTLASSGGRVVKNVAGYDLPKLATGALGTLGVITRAVFRLHPLGAQSLTLSFAAATIEPLQDKILAVLDAQLAQTALQIRAADSSPPEADILFEATSAGLLAQQDRLQKLLGDTHAERSEDKNWRARQELWDASGPEGVIAKLSLLPTEFAKTVRALEQGAASETFSWRIVLQATGIGWLRLDGPSARLRAAVERLRREVEDRGGSLLLLRRPLELDALDVWGSEGDAVPLMRAVKQRLDPKSTLNPGRFVGGI